MSSVNDRLVSSLGFSALRPYFHLLRGQKSDISLTVLLLLGSTAVTLSIPLFAGRFIDVVSNTIESTANQGAPPIDQNLILILVLLLVLQMAGNFFSQIVSTRLGLRTSVLLRRKIYSHLLELPSLYFGDKKAGDISTRVTSDVGAIQYMLTVGIFVLARAVITLIGAMVLMINLNPRLSSTVLILVPLTILLTRIFGSRLQRLSRIMYDELGKISSHVQETVGGVRTLKVYNAQRHERNRFLTMITTYEKAGMKRAWLSAALGSSSQICHWTCLLVVIIYGFTLTAQGQTSGGQLVTFLLLAFRVAAPLSSLSSLYSSTQGAIAAAGRLGDILSMETERTPDATTPSPCHDPVTILLENVSFRYPGTGVENEVLSGLSLVIESGRRVGIVGPSGAGKTTLASLLLGLYPPTAGTIELDGKPYSDFELAALRSRMAWVAQDPLLYDMSLAENIRFGLSGVSEEEIRVAAGMAEVLEFSDKLPDGLDTHCGERGVRLSGGQRQRVALARAFLRNPGLLVLDEPTSALDAVSEDSIHGAIRRVMAGRTTVIIAHRFSLVREMDVILVMADGRIVQSGSHAGLIKRDGLYRTLFELQQGETWN